MPCLWPFSPPVAPARPWMRRMLAWWRARRPVPWLQHRLGASLGLPPGVWPRLLQCLLALFCFFGTALFFSLLLLLGAFLGLPAFLSARAFSTFLFASFFWVAGALSSQLPASRGDPFALFRSCLSARSASPAPAAFSRARWQCPLRGCQAFPEPVAAGGGGGGTTAAGGGGGSAGVGGAGGGGGATSAGAACCGTADHSSASTAGWSLQSWSSSHPWSAPRSMRHVQAQRPAPPRRRRPGGEGGELVAFVVSVHWMVW